jgi:hypothetical protein
MGTKPTTIDAWTQWFAHIYEDKNARRGWDGFTTQMKSHALTLQSPKYIDQFAIVSKDLRSLFAWTFAVYNKISSRKRFEGYVPPLSVILLQEYPLVCPWCQEAKCIAKGEPDVGHASGPRKANRDMNRTRASRLIAQNSNAQKMSLVDFGNAINIIFERNATRPLKELAGKLGEEIVELEEALLELADTSNPAKLEPVFEELADVFAWACVLGQRVFAPPRVDTDSWLWMRYEGGCWKCGYRHPHALKCDCADYTKVDLDDRKAEVRSSKAESNTTGSPPIIVNVSPTMIQHQTTVTSSQLIHNLRQQMALDMVSPPLELLEDVEAEVNSGAPNAARLEEVSRKIIQSAPNSKRGSVYAGILKSLLQHTVAHLVAGQAAEGLHQLAAKLPEIVSSIANWGLF